MANYLVFVLGLIGALIMWATQVTPQQAVSHVSEWAKTFGLRDQPHWLKSENADRVIRHVATLLVAGCVIYGVFEIGQLGNADLGIKVLFGIGCLGIVAAVLWHLIFPDKVPQPIHIVGLGILIAAMGVVWQMYRGPERQAKEVSQSVADAFAAAVPSSFSRFDPVAAAQKVPTASRQKERDVIESILPEFSTATNEGISVRPESS